MKDGDCIQVRVGLATTGTTPFEITLLAETKKQGHGTEISAVLERHLLAIEELRQLIGSKFIVDPSLCIRVNQQPVELMSLEGLKTTEIVVEGHGKVTVHFIDSIEHYRSAKLRGITWWVNQRRVGEPSWDRLDEEGAYLDGRTEHAKKFSFIVMADFLTPGQDVKADWSDFHANQRTNAVRDAVHRYVIKEIQVQLATTRKERKKTAIENSRELMGELPTISKKAIGQFIDEVQEKCPTMSDRDLSRTVQVLAKLEQSRTGYDLLAQLAACSPDDLDTWNSLMQQWTASNAEIVLNELDRRLKLIERMEKLVENPLADELHDLQPLFERGLWVFGPEFESVDFRSNRGLAEVIGKFLGGADYKPPKRRPDFVVLPESSIGAYCADAYDAGGEISGIRKVAILELKKGGFCVTQKEADQARDYAKVIRKAGRVHASTEIVAFVLGATLEEGLGPADYGENKNTHIIPIVYQTVLRKADFEEMDCRDSTRTKLSAILPKTGKRFRFVYEYDFGDSWDHDVLFEGCVQAEPGRQYPLCLEGKRACPPEDVGGVPGYAEFLETIQNPDNEQHDEMLEWVGGKFDPEAFDAKKATKAMKKGLPDWRSERWS